MAFPGIAGDNGHMAFGSPRTLATPTPPQGEEIASFETYLEAQKAVDVLADSNFTVRAVTIVGTDLKMVERVTARLNYPRAALGGALSGMWLGLFVGLMFSLFSDSLGNIAATIATCVAIAAGFGMFLGVVSYALSGGKRDFTSQSQVVASRYSVLCLPELAADAREKLRGEGIATTSGAAARRAAAGAPTVVARPEQPAGPPRYGARSAQDAPVNHAAAQPTAAQPTAAQSTTAQRTPSVTPDGPPRYGQRVEQPAGAAPAGGTSGAPTANPAGAPAQREAHEPSPWGYPPSARVGAAGEAGPAAGADQASGTEQAAGTEQTSGTDQAPEHGADEADTARGDSSER